LSKGAKAQVEMLYVLYAIGDLRKLEEGEINEMILKEILSQQ